MIDYSVFQFACPPFCGASYFSDMMLRIGFPTENPHHLETPFLVGDPGCLKVSLVRHPVKWLSACHAAISDGLVDDPYPFTELSCSSLESFLRCYIRECPGALTEVFSKYQADTIMRLEDLPSSLVELLLDMKLEEGRARAVAKVPRYTFGGRHRKIDDRLLHKLREADREFWDRYDYL